jgi:hypothetical protein
MWRWTNCQSDISFEVRYEGHEFYASLAHVCEPLESSIGGLDAGLYNG